MQTDRRLRDAQDEAAEANPAVDKWHCEQAIPTVERTRMGSSNDAEKDHDHYSHLVPPLAQNQG